MLLYIHTETKMNKSDEIELEQRGKKKKEESQRLMTENEDKQDSIQTNDELQYVEKKHRPLFLVRGSFHGWKLTV